MVCAPLLKVKSFFFARTVKNFMEIFSPTRYRPKQVAYVSKAFLNTIENKPVFLGLLIVKNQIP